jgi:hypothetical protein
MKYKITIRICILSLIPIFFSCAKKDYKSIFSDVEKIKIIYYISEDEENYFIELIEKNEIICFINYMENILLPITPGGNINGIIEFYNNNQILINATFNIAFKEIVFAYNGENYQLRISNDGIKYLNKIKEEIIQNNNKKM